MADRYKGMLLTGATDQFRGREYMCACGMRVWSCWANAERHADVCPQADDDPIAARTNRERSGA